MRQTFLYLHVKGENTMEYNIANGFRAFADMVEDSPEVFDGPASMDFYVIPVEKARKILAKFPGAEIRIHQDHDLVQIIIHGEGFTASFNGQRDLAIPTIVDGKVVYVVNPAILPPTQVPA
jgi:hypothetical protein